MGPNVESLTHFFERSNHPIIASGGIRSLSDIKHLKSFEKKGLSGCIIGKAILSNQLDLNSIFSL